MREEIFMRLSQAPKWKIAQEITNYEAGYNSMWHKIFNLEKEVRELEKAKNEALAKAEAAEKKMKNMQRFLIDKWEGEIE